ncbi:MAG: BamA/TamA family outer membrane protein [Muribaculum sp.]|nr:BamA/TamA family outer membrane protein [Muribaculum sp.]
MLNSFKYIYVGIILLSSVLPVTMTAENHVEGGEKKELKSDSVASSDNIIKKVIRYFDSTNKRELTRRPDFSILGGPHYSSEKGLGLGLVVAGLYTTDPSDKSLPASNISLVGNIATKSYYMIGLEGAHVFPENSKRINYDLKFESFATYFWGIGYEMGNYNSNKTKYDLLKIDFNADMGWRIVDAFYAGPVIRIVHATARHIENGGIWVGQDHSATSLAGGVKLQYDIRDNFTAPKKGLFTELTQLFYPKFLGNKSNSFSSTEASFNIYNPVWKGGILAGRVHGLFTYGHTPWDMMAIIGGDNLRGYYEGRYRDKNELDFTIELRQHVWRRSGVAIWGGAACVFPKFSDIQFSHLLPDFGIGYRWEFKQNTNVRMDFGIGKHSTSFMFGLNEAF